jgi:hypothetical protein
MNKNPYRKAVLRSRKKGLGNPSTDSTLLLKLTRGRKDALGKHPSESISSESSSELERYQARSFNPKYPNFSCPF